LILSIDELINEQYLPVGISRSNMNKTTADIIKWWAERRIPAALRKNLCKNDQPQKNDFVVRAADRSLSFLFQYKLNTAVSQAHRAPCPGPAGVQGE